MSLSFAPHLHLAINYKCKADRGHNKFAKWIQTQSSCSFFLNCCFNFRCKWLLGGFCKIKYSMNMSYLYASCVCTGITLVFKSYKQEQFVADQIDSIHIVGWTNCASTVCCIHIQHWQCDLKWCSQLIELLQSPLKPVTMEITKMERAVCQLYPRSKRTFGACHRVAPEQNWTSLNSEVVLSAVLPCDLPQWGGERGS